MAMTTSSIVFSSKPRRIRKITIIKEMMYDRVSSGYEEVKMVAEREMDMTTDLLAGVGVEEPKILNIRSGILLKSYLVACTVIT